MLLTRNGSELISLLTSLSVIYLMCSVFLMYANGEQYDDDVNNGNNNNYYSNEKTENAIAPDEEMSLEHIERLCIEKCPDQVGNDSLLLLLKLRIILDKKEQERKNPPKYII
jgi:hypothetical protein